MKEPLVQDGEWSDFRSDPNYERLLRSTAWTWVSIIHAMAAAPLDLVGTPELKKAYYRVVLALPQLPLEGGDTDMRFHHARWRHAGVLPGAVKAHCEHPWSRRTTKDMVWNYVAAARSRRVPVDIQIAAVIRIMDSRVDTLLLPTMSIGDHGVIPETRGDGLLGRYMEPVSQGLILDRSTGQPITPEAIAADEAVRIGTINSIAASVGLAPEEVRRRPRRV